MEREIKMKLTAKLLKEMVRKELKETRDPFGKKSAYFGRGHLLGTDPDTQKREKEFQDQVDSREKESRDNMASAIASTVDEEWEYLDNSDEPITKEQVIGYLKGRILGLMNHHSDEEIYELYLNAKEG
jgi:hypothetical protein